MRTAFLGTPASAVPVLHALHAESEVVRVVSRQDRPRSRRGTPQPSPIKQAALELGLSTRDAAGNADVAAVLADLDLDLAVVAAFGIIIPPEALSIPTAGMVNVHFSLLPRWRGAAPIERAILAGDERTGVTLMQMDEGLDTGPLLAQWETSIGSDESAGRLTERLAVAGAELLIQLLPTLAAGEAEAVPQDDDHTTYARRIEQGEARLDLTLPAADVVTAIRAYNPRPGAFAMRDGERFKVLAARELPGSAPLGRMVLDGTRLVVGTGTGRLELVEVQPSGSRRMGGADWARGVRGELGILA